jgi:hypothetical protein
MWIASGNSPHYDAARRKIGLEVRPELQAFVRSHLLRDAIMADDLIMEQGSDGGRFKIRNHATLNPFGKWVDNDDVVAGSILPGQ